MDQPRMISNPDLVTYHRSPDVLPFVDFRRDLFPYLRQFRSLSALDLYAPHLRAGECEHMTFQVILMAWPFSSASEGLVPRMSEKCGIL